jgi:hypothetical protein
MKKLEYQTAQTQSEQTENIKTREIGVTMTKISTISYDLEFIKKSLSQMKT